MKEHFFSDYEARWNNIGELISVARKQLNADDAVVEANEPIVLPKEDETPDRDNIADFLEYCSLCSNQKEMEEAEGGVKQLHSGRCRFSNFF